MNLHSNGCIYEIPRVITFSQRTISFSLSSFMGFPPSMQIRMRKGRPRPRLTSNTLEPMALDTAMSPNPSLATRMELKASCKEGKRVTWLHYNIRRCGLAYRYECVVRDMGPLRNTCIRSLHTHSQTSSFNDKANHKCIIKLTNQTMLHVAHECTYRYASPNSHDNESHGELSNAEDTANSRHDGHHDKADYCNPEYGHEEGACDHIPLAVHRAVGDGPCEHHNERKGENKEDPLQDELRPAQRPPFTS